MKTEFSLQHIKLPEDTLEKAAELSRPKEPWDNSSLRLRFLHAGWRNKKAPIYFYFFKTSLALLCFALFLLLDFLKLLTLPQISYFAGMIVSTATGYYLPNLYLHLKIKQRKKELFDNFPDALDLLKICVESGLGLDAAIIRVGDEMKFKSAALYDELHLVTLEQRAGYSRNAALRNLAERIDLPEISALVTTLIQAEKFGISIAESLKIHAEGLRYNRKIYAEEQAAKIPTKILIPLILFIFPILFFIILAPAITQVVRLIRHTS